MGVKKTEPVVNAPAEFKRISYYDDRYYKIDITPPPKKAKGKKGKKKKKIAKIISRIFQFLPSVTTILDIVNKPYLNNWKATVGLKESSRISSEALKRGSNVHAGSEVLANEGLCLFRGEEQYINYDEVARLERQFGQVYVVTDQVVYLQINRVYQFMQTLGLIIHEVEKTVYSLIHGYAGTLDLVAEVPKEGDYPIGGSKPVHLKAGKYIMDYKTGKSADSPDYLRQLSAYYIAYMELNPDEELEGAILVHTNSRTKTGIVGLNCIVLDIDTLESLFEEFLTIKAVYMLENPTPAYKELDFPEFLTLVDKDPYQLELTGEE